MYDLYFYNRGDSRKPSGVYGFKSESMCQIAVRNIRQIAIMAVL